MTDQEADERQQWKGMDGATAFHLIERHAESWIEIRAMMHAWLRANQIEEFRVDALRYRWLRENNDKRFILWDRCSHELALSPRPVLFMDTVIDKQIGLAESESGGGG